MSVKIQVSAVAVIALASVLTANGHFNRSGSGTDAPVATATPVLINNNNHALGPIIDSAQSVVFYSKGLNLLVPIDSAGNVGVPFEEYFTSADCTGTPYYLIPGDTPEPDTSVNITLLSSGAGGYFRVEDTPPASVAMHSAQDPGSCDVAGVTGYALPVTPVKNLPFTAPISLPVHLRK